MVDSQRNGTIYTGVTSDLTERAYQHRHGMVEGFSKQDGCKLLVWFEPHATINAAITREKQIKEWRRAWKLKRIQAENPAWSDLTDDLLGPAGSRPSPG